jgi:hypothetical protein
MSDPIALATLIFAATAGVGSVVRVYQNERLWRAIYRPKRMSPRPRAVRTDYLSSVLAELPDAHEDGCCHQSVTWTCLNCRQRPLSPGLPDYHAREDQQRPNAA